MPLTYHIEKLNSKSFKLFQGLSVLSKNRNKISLDLKSYAEKDYYIRSCTYFHLTIELFLGSIPK